MTLAFPACSDDTQEGSGGSSGEGGDSSSGEGGDSSSGEGGGGSSGEGGGSSGEGGGGTGGFTFSGPITGETVPEDATVVVIWPVSSSSPDYAVSFGKGSVSGATFTVGFGSAPPRVALNRSGVGVGIVALLPPGTQLPEGKLDPETVDITLLGVSPRHAVIWRDASGEGLGWSDSFPDGFACGKCVDSPPGEGFDFYEPVDCSQVEVQTTSDADSLDGCNWT
ncbi:hypothetical protein WME90_27265 [Sorangium sp. So ce375]|uniref:hypothetical protein n=1 Tax=Sorangium sp. So ce375 TaxID=3133306 RepID=UPI003F5BEA3A